MIPPPPPSNLPTKDTEQIQISCPHHYGNAEFCAIFIDCLRVIAECAHRMMPGGNCWKFGERPLFLAGIASSTGPQTPCDRFLAGPHAHGPDQGESSATNGSTGVIFWWHNTHASGRMGPDPTKAVVLTSSKRFLPVMRLFAYIIAVLSLAVCLGCIIAIPKFHAIYHEMNAELPVLTKFVLTYGVLLSALFLVLAVALVVLAAVNKPRVAASLAGLTLLLSLSSGIVVPVALMLPMSSVVQSLEEDGPEEEAPPGAPGSP
jgi:hypothetical protein